MSSYRHESTDFSYGAGAISVSIGRDFECVLSDGFSKIFYIFFDGISNVTVSPFFSFHGVRNLKMMTDGSYTLI